MWAVPASVLYAQSTSRPQVPIQAVPQATAQSQFSVSNVFREMNGPTVAGIPEANLQEPLWWDQHVASAQRDELPNLGTVSYTHLTLPTIYSV